MECIIPIVLLVNYTRTPWVLNARLHPPSHSYNLASFEPELMSSWMYALLFFEEPATKLNIASDISPQHWISNAKHASKFHCSISNKPTNPSKTKKKKVCVH
jgi:hypothetical protein